MYAALDCEVQFPEVGQGVQVTWDQRGFVDVEGSEPEEFVFAYCFAGHSWTYLSELQDDGPLDFRCSLADAGELWRLRVHGFRSGVQRFGRCCAGGEWRGRWCWFRGVGRWLGGWSGGEFHLCVEGWGGSGSGGFVAWHEYVEGQHDEQERKGEYKEFYREGCSFECCDVGFFHQRCELVWQLHVSPVRVARFGAFICGTACLLYVGVVLEYLDDCHGSVYTVCQMFKEWRFIIKVVVFLDSGSVVRQFGHEVPVVAGVG